MLKTRRSAVVCAFTAALLGGCGGEMSYRDQYSMEYETSVAGKPVVYPADVSAPEQSRNYEIPALSSVPQLQYDIDQLVKPPRLVPEPDQEEVRKRSAEEARATTRSKRDRHRVRYHEKPPQKDPLAIDEETAENNG